MKVDLDDRFYEALRARTWKDVFLRLGLGLMALTAFLALLSTVLVLGALYMGMQAAQ